jgi:hypothetical protein
MTCYDDFPLSTVIYNWAVVGGLAALGAFVAARVGAALLVGYVLLLLVAFIGTMATICTRCAGYYGRRCGLGLGAIVPLFFRQRPTDHFLRPPAIAGQIVFLALFLVAVAWPIVGGAVLLARAFSIGRLVQLVAAVALLLAFALPHPRLVCSHCRQGASGDCPLGCKVRGGE